MLKDYVHANVVTFLSARDRIVLESCVHSQKFLNRNKYCKSYALQVLNPLFVELKKRISILQQLQKITLPEGFFITTKNSNYRPLTVNSDQLMPIIEQYETILDVAVKNLFVCDSVNVNITFYGTSPNITMQHKPRTSLQEPRRLHMFFSYSEYFHINQTKSDEIQAWKKDIPDVQDFGCLYNEIQEQPFLLNSINCVTKKAYDNSNYTFKTKTTESTSNLIYW